jgi:hypothetical protein
MLAWPSFAVHFFIERIWLEAFLTIDGVTLPKAFFQGSLDVDPLIG